MRSSSSERATESSARRSSASAAASSALPASTVTAAASSQECSTSTPESSDAKLSSTSRLCPAPSAGHSQSPAQGSADKDSALAVLMRLEARTSSTSQAAQKGKHWFEPMYCCFDLAGWPGACGWKAERMCERCEALYALSQEHSKAGKDGQGRGIAQALLSTVADATDCTRCAAYSETTPALPNELIDLIWDQLILDAHNGYGVQAVQALMHTCVRTRARLLQDIEPLIMRRCTIESTESEQEAEGTWLEPFCAFIEWHIQSALRSVTLDRDEATSQAPPRIPQSSDWITSARVKRPKSVVIRIDLYGELVYTDVSPYMEVSKDRGHRLRMCDIVLAFEDVFEEAELSWHRLAPYLRARREWWHDTEELQCSSLNTSKGWYSASESRCRIEFSITLCDDFNDFELVRKWDVCAPDWQPKADDKPLPG